VIREALTGPSFATTLLAVMFDFYGEDFIHGKGQAEFLDWDEETIKLQLESDFGISLPEANLHRIMAGIAILTTNFFYRRIDAFVQLCNVLSGDEFDPRVFNTADVDEMAWGITEAALLFPPGDSEEFSEEILEYIRVKAKSEGIATLPDVLAIANTGEDPLYEYADDPEMYGAMFTTVNSKSEEIKYEVAEGLQRLVSQLGSLPLRNGSAKDMAKRLSASIRSTAGQN